MEDAQIQLQPRAQWLQNHQIYRNKSGIVCMLFQLSIDGWQLAGFCLEEAESSQLLQLLAAVFGEGVGHGRIPCNYSLRGTFRATFFAHQLITNNKTRSRCVESSADRWLYCVWSAGCPNHDDRLISGGSFWLANCCYSCSCLLNVMYISKLKVARYELQLMLLITPLLAGRSIGNSSQVEMNGMIVGERARR